MEVFWVVVVVDDSAEVVEVVTASPFTFTTYEGGAMLTLSETALITFLPASVSFTLAFPSASVTASVSFPLTVILAPSSLVVIVVVLRIGINESFDIVSVLYLVSKSH